MRNRFRRLLCSVITSHVMAERVARHRATGDSIDEVEGRVLQVDPVGREMPVLVNDTTVNFYVPLDCRIELSGESVRMRHLHPQDRVRVTFSVEHGVTIAHAINVTCANSAWQPRKAVMAC